MGEGEGHGCCWLEMWGIGEGEEERGGRDWGGGLKDVVLGWGDVNDEEREGRFW